MKYKVGDRVLVHTLEHLKSIAIEELDHNSLRLPGALLFINKMRAFCDKALIISSIEGSYYLVKENDCGWTDEMLAEEYHHSLRSIYE